MKDSLLLRLTILSLLLFTATSATAESIKPLKGADSLKSVLSQPDTQPIDKPIENPPAATDPKIKCTTTGNPSSGSSVSCSGSIGTSPEAVRRARKAAENAND